MTADAVPAVDTLRKGNRLAILAPLAEGRWTVWVGYDPDIGAYWFKGRTTCGAEYATRANAERAAYKFLNH